VSLTTPYEAEVLARIRYLHLRARHVVDGLMSGGHRSGQVGQAVEFADYQAYTPGVDPRTIDWRVWARTDRMMVRRFEKETEVACRLVLDLSGDLSTGDDASVGRPDLAGTKAGYAVVLAATLAYFLHLQGEPVGLEVVAGEGVLYASIPPKRGRHHLQTILRVLAMAKPGGKADLGAALERVGAGVRRRSWVAVLTDGMEEPSEWLPKLRVLAQRGADVRLVHLLDVREWSLAEDTPARWYSPEGGEEVAIDPLDARPAMRRVVNEYLREVRGGVVGGGGRYVPAPTHRPLEKLMRSLVLDHRNEAVPEVGWAPS
jgi:uncharacterized protein (DUF58 family)